MGEGPFGREARKTSGRDLRWLVVALVLSGAGLVATRFWPATTPEPWMEVGGDVPNPGRYRGATVADVVAAAGGDVIDPRAAKEGWVATVGADVVVLAPPRQPLLVGLPVDLNQATAAQLAAIPEISQAVADAVVADRALRGPFYAAADVERVSGVGKATSARFAPFLTVSEPVPVSLQEASAARLTTLPGIGDALAARIVADRQANGPYENLQAVTRVDGVTAATVASWSDRATP